MKIKRKNGDSEIDYLVNDGTLNLDTLKDKNVIIVGERHGYKGDMDLVGKLIETLEPDYILVEALLDYVLHDRNSKLLQLKKPTSMHMYGALTKLWLEFSLKYDRPFIGMECVDWEQKVGGNNLVDQFEVREQHFIKMIGKYSNKGKVIAVTGDTHVRTIKTEQLGEISPLYLRYNEKKDSAVIRTAEGEIE